MRTVSNANKGNNLLKHSSRSNDYHGQPEYNTAHIERMINRHSTGGSEPDLAQYQYWKAQLREAMTS